MIAAPAAPAQRRSVTVDRRGLLGALAQAKAVVATRSFKPILRCVRLHTADDRLWIDATDGEIRLTMSVAASGKLPDAVVECDDLIARLKASKNAETVLSVRSRPTRLIVNGGSVEHALNPFPAVDFPPIPDKPEGTSIPLSAADLRRALHVTGHAVAKETTRYALNGILLESDAQGLRLAATDGRRLATVTLSDKSVQFQGEVILPARFAKLAERLLTDLDSAVISIAEKKNDKGEPLPAELFIAGENWLLSTTAGEGTFPGYRNVIPADGSRFLIERQPLIDAISEVALATDLDNRGVRMGFSPRRLELTALSGSRGSAAARLPVKFLGGGDSVINTGFNPDFLLDALKTLDGDRAVIELQQNLPCPDGKVAGRPAKVYAEADTRLRWVVMPIDTGLEPTRENLGSNFSEPEAATSGLACAG